jgi:hypothetical protein
MYEMGRTTAVRETNRFATLGVSVNAVLVTGLVAADRAPAQSPVAAACTDEPEVGVKCLVDDEGPTLRPSIP